MTGERTWLERLLIWRVWERLLEIEFLDRSIALAGKAFVSFFPHGDRCRGVPPRAGMRVDPHRAHVPAGPAGRHPGSRPRGVLVVRRAARRDQLARALLDVVLRRLVRDGSPAHLPTGVAAAALPRGSEGTCAAPSSSPSCWPAWLPWARRGKPPTEGWESAWSPLVGFVVTTGVWWFTAWYLLLGDVRARVLLPTGLVTGVTTGLVRRLGDGVDARGRGGERSPVRLLRHRPVARHVVLGRGDLHPGRGLHRAGAGRGRRLARHPPPRRRRNDLGGGRSAAAPPTRRELTLRDAFQSTDDS